MFHFFTFQPRVLFLIVSVGFLLLWSCSENLPVADETFTVDDTRYEIAKDVEILYSDSAVVRVRITAPTLLNFSQIPSPRREFPDGIRVEFFDELKRTQSRLTAKYAVQYDLKKIIIVEDSVVIQTSTGEKIETEGLVWNENTRRVHSDRFLRVTTPDETLEGYGLDADYNFQNWEIKKVRGPVKSERFSETFKD